jgi:streptogramin lyase
MPKLAPTPATINAANPAAKGAGTIIAGYNGSDTAGTTLHCNATAPGGLTAQYSVPRGITAGPDGNLWFAEYSGNQIGKVTIARVVTEYAAGITASAAPAEIVTGSDGNLWFTELSGDRIGKMVP